MNKTATTFQEYLVQARLIPERDVRQALQLATENTDSLSTLLIRLGLISEHELAKAYSTYLNLPVTDREQMLHSGGSASDTISPRFLQTACVFPYLRGSRLILAMRDPEDAYSQAALHYFFDRPCTVAVATQQDIQACILHVYGAPSALEDSDRQPDGDDEEDIDRLRDLATEAPVIQLVQRLMTEAIEQQCSDIHFEPLEDALSVRFRVDGILREMHRHPAALRAPVISRIKILAQLNIAERRVPQDGRMRMTIHGRETDFRVVTAPTLHGESAVLRILDQRDVTLDFPSLGFGERDQSTLKTMLEQPHGIILVTGPTGSGKTTTLYAALNLLNTPERKILTAEDPIEYSLSRINQVQVSPKIGHDFASALRSFLRQDPDVIMVGEIRDRETMQMAVQASLTGHLLLATLHTNSAAGAVTRLLDMGAEEYLLASTLRLVIAQRLVRRLCAHCKQPSLLDPDVARSLGIEAKVAREAPVVYKPAGCAKCRNSGYLGRVSIVELLTVNRELEAMILARRATSEIEARAVELGMTTMLHDGLDKALAGLTSVEEVMRAVQSG